MVSVAVPPPAPWQQGYPLALLRALAAPFRAAIGPYSYGAYDCPREREVANALVARAWHQAGPPEAPTAVCISGRAQTLRTDRDFAGRGWGISPADLQIKDVGYLDLAALDGLLARAERAAGGHAVWLTLCQEDAALRARVLTRGYRYVGTKIAASSQLRGVYVLGGPRLPPHRPADTATLALLDPAFVDAATLTAIAAEVRAADALWAQHYSSYNARHSWTAFALWGYDATDPTFIIKPAEMARGWQTAHPDRMAAVPAPTPALAQFPATAALLARLRPPFDRARFMRLAPDGGELTRHADITNRTAGTRPGLCARLHLPILTNPAVRFRAWAADGTALDAHLAPGGLYYLDQRKPHQVVNPGAVERVHLVVDVWVDAAWEEALAHARPA